MYIIIVISFTDLCRPNNLPVGEGAHKMPIDPPSELRKLLLRDVKQENGEYRANTLQSIEHSLPYYGRTSRSAAISQFARVLRNQREEEEIARCSTCFAGLPSKSLLFKHLRIHNDDKYHKYFECEEKFYPQSLLSRHQDKHREKDQHCCSTSRTQAQEHAHKRNLSIHGSVVAEHPLQSLKGKEELSSKSDEEGERPPRIEMRNGRPMFICPICAKGYTRTYNLNKHKVLKHTGLYPHSCPSCGRGFISECGLTRHISIHIVGKRFRCPECNKRFTRKRDLRRHLKNHAGLRRYDDCPQCHRGYWKREYLVRHMEEYNHGKRWQCTTCDKSYESEIAFKVHMNSHSRVKQYDCSVCHQAFMYKQSRDKHMKKHQKHHKCGECDEEFLYEKNLEKHRRGHSGEKPFKCSECQKEFMFHNNLQKHMERHTTPRPHPCPKCDRGFYFKSNLNKHVRKHTAPKPFQCSFCNKGFNFKRNLRRHTKSAHPEEDDLQCSECYESFTSSTSMYTHMKTHFDESSYACPKCMKKHPSKFALSVHMSKHIGIARHKCRQCKTILTTRRKRVGSKLPTCSQCEKRYITNGELIRHENTHSKEQPSESGGRVQDILPQGITKKLSKILQIVCMSF